MKKEERKSLEKHIAAAINNALPAGLAAAKGKSTKVINNAARDIAKKFAKELKKIQKVKAAPKKKAAAPKKKAAKKKVTKK